MQFLKMTIEYPVASKSLNPALLLYNSFPHRKHHVSSSQRRMQVSSPSPQPKHF